jgi:hypothetical protein
MRTLLLASLLLAPAAALAAPFLPLAEGEGLVFCPEPGCKVTLNLDAGGTQTLDPGSKVKVLDEGKEGSPVLATVEAKGQRGKLPAVNVISAGRLARSPDGKVAIFFPLEACDGACRAQTWIVTPEGWTQLEGADAPRPAIAWRSDGKQVIVGAGQLFTVELPGLEVSRADRYHAPAFAPDGTLYVRSTADDAVHRVGKRGALEKVGAPPRGKAPPGAEPAPPVTFEEDGKVVVATFRRTPEDAVVRYRAGKK